MDFHSMLNLLPYLSQPKNTMISQIYQLSAITSDNQLLCIFESPEKPNEMYDESRSVTISDYGEIRINFAIEIFDHWI